MPSYAIETVETKSQKREFMHLIWRLYKGDPNWIPPLRRNQEELVGFFKHPFYERNKIRTFLVKRDGTTVGRIAAIVNYGHNERYEEKRGFFGFFDCEDDQQAANMLFKAAADYLRSEGMTDARGPCNPSLNYEIGCLVDGFDSPPTFQMTYNWPYYEKLILGAGYVKTQDLFAFEGNASKLDTLDPKLSFVIKEVKRRFNVTLRKADSKKLAKEAALFVDIYNRALVATWGFVPLSPKEAQHIAGSLKLLIEPEATTIIEIEGKTIGVALGLLDFNPIIKKIDGRLFPFGFLKLLFGRKNIKRVRLMSNNILPEYQRWGLGLVALERMLPELLARGITECEFSWVLESNRLSRGTLEAGGADLSKTYRLFDRKLD
ncbi:MAG: N-acetyltransferase [Pirellulaceae bacterium]|nr:N-acetyltransferase [Pirellulaceae bacterium]